MFLSYSLASKCKLIPWRTKEVFVFPFEQLYDHDVDELFFCCTATLVFPLYLALFFFKLSSAPNNPCVYPKKGYHE